MYKKSLFLVCSLGSFSFLFGFLSDSKASQQVSNETFIFPDSFYFGLANGPAHVEDQLNDSWLRFAKEGKVASYSNQNQPDYRNGFWSNPTQELDIAKNSGVKVFRMGVDWGRLVPRELGHDYILDPIAVDQYRAILTLAKARGLNVMLTLFHHSLPLWLEDQGGWKNEKSRKEFVRFAEASAKAFGDLVDDWIPFNEPSVFVGLTYVGGLWPPGKNYNPFGILSLGPFQGVLDSVQLRMAATHKDVYQVLHKSDQVGGPTRVGLAHNVALYTPSRFVDRFVAYNMHQKMNLQFPKLVFDHLDFLGINYYGEEHIQWTSVSLDEKFEFSDSGRGINPKGLYSLTKELWTLVSSLRSDAGFREALPFVITENGISDASDQLRPAYITEHLWAVSRLIRDQIPVEGYIFWTTADNWEWADGYCPRFGLYKVERQKDRLLWTPRDSYLLFSKIATQRILSRSLRDEAWQKVAAGSSRFFCRGPNGRQSLDNPITRPISSADWRYFE
jgi:beta-glucosidase/6-phospho-beta-glucosidase/beta-galactosidase